MNRVFLGVLALSAGGWGWEKPRTPAAPPRATVTLSDAEQEEFLLEASVVARRSAPGGRTLSTRATLRRGDLVHDAHVQTHDEYKSQLSLATSMELDFRDSWRNNVAAYRLDRLLGLGMVPVTVVRRDEGKMASFTWWVDDVLMTEKERYERKVSAPDVEAWNQQIFVVRVFDQLIYNFDRNLGNLLIDEDWRLWMIDHTRAFKVFKELRSEKSLPERCEKDLLAAMRGLDRPALDAPMEGLLSGAQTDGLLARRDAIVRRYEQDIATRGESAVLYDLPPRPLEVVASR